MIIVNFYLLNVISIIFIILIYIILLKKFLSVK